MTAARNQNLGAFAETSVGGDRVCANVPAPLPPNPPLDLAQLMNLYKLAVAAFRRLDGMATILASTPYVPSLK